MKLWRPLLLLTLALGVANAQPPIPWWENPIGNGLVLSDAQRDRVNSIVSEFRDRLTMERQEAERAEREFESVVNADTVDSRRGWIAVEQLVRARSVFTKDISTMTLRLRAVLTADQWRMLQERQGARSEHERMEHEKMEQEKGRPGGPGRRGLPLVPGAH
jgi:Spy/CpxP family protein refolding chaperone